MTTYNATSSSQYQKMILELLDTNDREFKTAELYNHIEQNYNLTEADLQLKKDGSEPVWKNMVRRSVLTLRNKELIVIPKRGTVQITALGKECLAKNDFDIKTIKKPITSKVKKETKTRSSSKLSILDLCIGDKVAYNKSWYNEGVVVEVNKKRKYVKILFDGQEKRIFSNAQNLKKIDV